MANEFLKTHLPRYQEKGFDYLRGLDEVARFLDPELFERITLIRQQVIVDLLLLEFEVHAPELLPNPRARLLEKGVVKRHNLLHSGKDSDEVRQTIGFFGNCLQIRLNFLKQTPTSDNSGIS